MLDLHYERWLALFPEAPKDLAANAYKRLRAHYAEPHRAYHNFQHIDACLRHLDSVRDQLTSFHVIEMAIWYHDVIYDTHKNDNEAQSANYAFETLAKLNISEENRNLVHKLIMATKHPSIPDSLEERYLLDIDLSILGTSSEIFDVYEKQIREEYQWVPEIIYKEGRSKVLQAFLDQPAIYHTEIFFRERETLARRNLERVIAEFDGGKFWSGG
ncbi:N-methyl-D-aspartate receptor NMDAR2C subunit [Marinobacter sp.]|uniref:HD domain-containing protein n=1 Tax=Marinobacter sp. TaxID=50741 RepID=UPI003A8CCC81